VPTAAGARLRIYVQPRASQTAIAGLHGGALKLRLAAPPVDGAANDALIRFLAERLGVARSAITLESGAAARTKVVHVAGVTPDEAERRLAPGDAGD
jgi:hypothetical protein